MSWGQWWQDFINKLNGVINLPEEHINYGVKLSLTPNRNLNQKGVFHMTRIKND